MASDIGGSMAAGKDYRGIIGQLENLIEHCSDMAKGGGEAPWNEDVKALQEAIDIINDYESVVDYNNRMTAHYEVAEKPRRIAAGVYVCTYCGKRTQHNHSHCHWCGKKLGWR